MTFTLPFSTLDVTLARVGGKGMNLAELAQAGFPVPPGFLVTTEAYRVFVNANDIQPRILTLARNVQADDPVALENASAEIESLFARGGMPDEFVNELVSAYAELSGRAALPVAVRSSATAEDLPELSFAGQQETYLNIVGAPAVLDVMKKCWASLWTARAIGYRARNHIPPDEVALAVVVQRMIPAEVSGVLFTANPLTGRREQIVMDASFNSVQGVMEPLTPMGRTALRMIIGMVPRLLDVQRPVQEIFPDAGGRLFIDITEVARDPRLRHVALSGLSRVDPGARQALLRLSEAGRIKSEPVATPGRMLGLLFAARPVLARVLAALRNPEKMRAAALADADRFLARVRANAQSAHDLPARLEAMERDLGQAFVGLLGAVAPLIFPVVAGMSIVDRWLVEWLGLKPGAVLALMRGLPGNVTTEMDLKLWAAARMTRADPQARARLLAQTVEESVEAYRQRSLPQAAQAALEKFFGEYGMRAVAEIDFGRPRWREDPSSILQTLHSYLRLEHPNLAPDVVFPRGAAESERLAQEYIARVKRTHFGAIRARLLRAAIRRLRLLGGLREAPKFYMIKVLDLYRTALLESGRELVARGALERPEDIFFVPFDELKRAGHSVQGDITNLKRLVAIERAEYDRERARRQLPRLLLSTGEVFYQGVSSAEAGPNDLVGDPVSPGVAEGNARVVLDPRGVRLEPGEILICPATDPGWTPLFLTAGGLVMEIGGLVTHGAVVAREYGIPAIVGVSQVTSRLHTGQRVRVTVLA
ncbi:MAG: PEP/pyruvate-binding domain-containing protein [Anaerolineales bacterium]